jgi:hypothetical protein
MKLKQLEQHVTGTYLKKVARSPTEQQLNEVKFA